MKNILYPNFRLLSKSILLGLFILLTFKVPLKAQSSEYSAATWYENKEAAITYTFDGYQSGSFQLSVAVPLFDTYNYKVTLCTITNWITNWSGLIAAANNGHEIASLTVTHTSLEGQTLESQEYELSESQRIIDSVIPYAKCLSLAYPYCDPGDLDLVKQYYLSARICDGEIEPASPSNMYQLSSILTGTEGTVVSSDDLNGKVDLALTAGGWCIFLIHGIDSDIGYSPIASRNIKKHLAYVNENDSLFWVATFLDATKYIRERNNVSFSEETIDEDSIRVTITDNLPDSIYNHDLTILRTLPSGWPSANVYINNQQVTSTTIKIENDTCVQFNAIPDLDVVYLSKSNTPYVGISNNVNQVKFNLYPNPFNHTVTIDMDGYYSYSIYSISGQCIESGLGYDKTIIGKDIEPGVFILQVQNKSGIFTKRIIKTE